MVLVGILSAPHSIAVRAGILSFIRARQPLRRLTRSIGTNGHIRRLNLGRLCVPSVVYIQLKQHLYKSYVERRLRGLVIDLYRDILVNRSPLGATLQRWPALGKNNDKWIDRNKFQTSAAWRPWSNDTRDQLYCTVHQFDVRLARYITSNSFLQPYIMHACFTAARLSQLQQTGRYVFYKPTANSLIRACETK